MIGESKDNREPLKKNRLIYPLAYRLRIRSHSQ